MKFCIICNLHFGVSGGFFQGAKLRTLVYVISFFYKIAFFNYLVNRVTKHMFSDSIKLLKKVEDLQESLDI
jgi:hypothetical protein